MNKTTRKRQLVAWLFLFPGLAIFSLFVFIPIIVTMAVSFTEYDSLNSPSFVGLAQYKQLFASGVFWSTLKNSLLLTVGVVLTLTLIPIPVAYVLERHIRGLGWVRALLYIPVIAPIIVSAVAWKWLLTDEGIFNWILMQLHLIEKPIRWLNDPSYALWSILIVVFWRAFGFYLVIYISGLLGIPRELYESAAIDGANGLQTFFRITVPMLKNTISLVTIVSFIAAMKIFDEIFIMTKGGPINASKTTAYYIYEEAFVNAKFGYSSAIAVVLLVIVTAFTMLLLNFFEKDEVKYE